MFQHIHHELKKGKLNGKNKAEFVSFLLADKVTSEENNATLSMTPP